VDLADSDIEKHMAVAFEYVMETLGADASDAAARRLDPAGEKALGLAKRMRRQALREGGGRAERVEETAQQHFGLPTPALEYWRQSRAQRPWRRAKRRVFLEHALREFRIRLPLRRAHHLSQEKRHQLHLASLVASDFGRMRAEHIRYPTRHHVRIRHLDDASDSATERGSPPLAATSANTRFAA